MMKRWRKDEGWSIDQEEEKAWEEENMEEWRENINKLNEAEKKEEKRSKTK